MSRINFNLKAGSTLALGLVLTLVMTCLVTAEPAAKKADDCAAKKADECAAAECAAKKKADDCAATKCAAKKASSNADFERIKSLAGTWEGTMISTHEGDGPKTMTVTYAVTAGGSAVVETMAVGSPHEMVSVYHLDGDQLVMTHYCMLGNQPKMSAVDAGGDPAVIAMTCSGGTNIPDENLPHMHAMSMTFKSPDHVIADWVMHQDGQVGAEAHLDLRRKGTGS